jgi:two-component system, chemotaxis family, sensor kinase CheA
VTHVDLKEFLSPYLAEVDEQLQLANTKILEIDGAARKGELHPRAVRDLFRALHTIKGLSAMVEVEPAVTISHRVETILRAADRRGGRLAPDALELLLQSVREIDQHVRELSEGRPASPASEALLKALDQLELGEPAGATASVATLDLDPALASKLAPFELDLLTRGQREGRRAVLANFRPSPAQAERGFSINTVRERVGSLAEIVKTIPVAVTPSEEAPGGLCFALLLSTSVSNEEIANAAGVDPSEVSTLGSAAAAADVAPAVFDEQDFDLGVSQRRNLVRVDVAKLDDAMEHLSSLIVTRSRLARAVSALTLAGVNTRDLRDVMRDNARQLRDLRAAILRVRMVPVVEVLNRIPLILRGLQRESKKEVRLELDAGTAELDKGVAERLFPALVHLMRNAVDHAIEPAEERVRLGKFREGLLRISCSSRSNADLELSLSDDGAGVDREAVARRLGRDIPPGDAALLDALCQVGLSTRDRATTTSGRGMGMDIVRRVVVDQLGGELSMRTRAGIGTTFVLRVPLTLSIVDTFTLECRQQRFVVPVATVAEILELDPAAVRFGPAPRAAGRTRVGLLEHRGEAVPLLDLAALLRMPEEAALARQAVVVRRAGEVFAFGLDRVLGQQESVVRPLVDPLVQVPGIAGATDLGDGRPTLVLDLLSLAAPRGAREERAA